MIRPYDTIWIGRKCSLQNPNKLYLWIHFATFNFQYSYDSYSLLYSSVHILQTWKRREVSMIPWFHRFGSAERPGIAPNPWWWPWCPETVMWQWQWFYNVLHRFWKLATIGCFTRCKLEYYDYYDWYLIQPNQRASSFEPFCHMFLSPFLLQLLLKGRVFHIEKPKSPGFSPHWWGARAQRCGGGVDCWCLNLGGQWLEDRCQIWDERRNRWICQSNPEYLGFTWIRKVLLLLSGNSGSLHLRLVELV